MTAICHQHIRWPSFLCDLLIFSLHFVIIIIMIVVDVSFFSSFECCTDRKLKHRSIEIKFYICLIVLIATNANKQCLQFMNFKMDE